MDKGNFYFDEVAPVAAEPSFEEIQNRESIKFLLQFRGEPQV